MSYSVDLRERALSAARNGHTKAEVSEMFGLGVNTLRDWENLEAETGSLENRPLSRTGYKIDREKLVEWYRKNPYSTNKETAIALAAAFLGFAARRRSLELLAKKHNSICRTQRTKKGRIPCRSRGAARR